MKKIFLFLVLFTGIAFGQNQTFNGTVTVKNTPTGTASDSVLVRNSAGLIRMVKKSDFSGNLKEFNQIGVSKTVLTAGTWDANIREIGNVLRIDANNLVMVYTGTTVPYTHGVSEFIGLATSNNNGQTWVKGVNSGKIISTNAEDPYIVRNPANGVYHIYAERKDSSITYKHADIELFTSSNLTSWTSQGIILAHNVSNPWETTDVSSPTVFIENGTWKMYYEGRSYTASDNAGLICMATSTDGVIWTKSGSNPLIYGSQWNSTPTVDWATYIVPDDIKKVDGKYFMTCHVFNGIDFVEALLTSDDGIAWNDKLGTWITNQTNNDYSGDGFLFFEGKIIWNDLTNIYLGESTISPYRKDVFTSRTVYSYSQVISGNRNETINCPLTVDTSIILGRNVKNNNGVVKRLKNDSDHVLTITPATSVLVNGSNSTFTVPKHGILEIIGIGVNSWMKYENENLVHKTGNESIEGNKSFINKVGVGTTSPSAPLHISDLTGNGEIKELARFSFANATNTGGKFNFYAGDDVAPITSIISGLNSDVIGYFKFNNYIVGVGDVNAMVVVGDKVGIGTETPTEALDVVGNGYFSGNVSSSAPTLGYHLVRKDYVDTRGVTDTSTIALTSSYLNSTYSGYSNFGTGFKVYATSILAGAIIYEKTDVANQWTQTPTTVAP